MQHLLLVRGGPWAAMNLAAYQWLLDLGIE